MKRTIRTDLASELDLTGEGIVTRERTASEVGIYEVEIRTDGASERLHKPKGRYVTLNVGRLWLDGDTRLDELAQVLTDELLSLVGSLCGEIPERVLIVGLGNRRIAADALGDEVVSRLTVTRHLRAHGELWKLFGGREISAVIPGVIGQTGIESAELVKGVCEHVKPELVIAIDSLCARSIERLATTIQLGTSGLEPGSGVGNRRLALDTSTLGVPVLALGVPMAVDSSTLVVDALERAALAPNDRLSDLLETGSSFIVTPKESDIIVASLASLISAAIARVFAA